MKPTLLIVDDIQSVREKLGEVLAGDFEVVGLAGSGAQAIAMAQTFAPQLILMDLVMPQMSGLEATKAILALANPAPRVVILSALHEENVVLEAFEAGAAEYLIKPVSENKIREVLHGLSRIAA